MVHALYKEVRTKHHEQRLHRIKQHLQPQTTYDVRAGI